MRKILSVSIIIILCGCTISPNKINDGGFLSREPCGPPCFLGISPGITSQTDAIKITQNPTRGLSGCEYRDFTAYGGKSGINCDYVDMIFQNDIVEVLGYRPSTRITSQQVIDEYGNPDRASVYITSLPDKPFRVVMDFCYDRLQATVGFSEQSGVVYTVNSKTLVYKIDYESVASYQNTCGSSDGKTYWVGYGEYKPTWP